MIKSIVVSILVIISQIGLSQIDLNTIDSLHLWVNSSNVEVNGDNLVFKLVDLSENGLDVSTGTASTVIWPELIENNQYINGNSLLRFDGINDFMFIDENSLPNYEHTIFLVSIPHNSSGTKVLMSRSYQSDKFSIKYKNQKIQSTVNVSSLNSIDDIAENMAYIIESGYNSQQRILRVNSSPPVTSNQTGFITYNSVDDAVIGCMRKNTGARAFHYEGDLAEIIIYNKYLDSTERVMVREYLENKYVPALDLGADTIIKSDFCETILDASNRFISYQWSTGETSSQVEINQSGWIHVSVLDIFGNTQTDSIFIEYPSIEYPSSQLYCPNSFIPWNPGLNNSFNFLWNTNDISSTLDISSEGEYSFVVTDNLGCVAYSDTLYFNQDFYPETISLGPDTSLCSGNAITFIGGFNDTESFQWSNTDTTQSIIIDTSGLYSIEAINSNGCIGLDTIEVSIIGDAPDLSYSIPFEICQGSELNFTENSTVPPGNTISQVVWDFGDLDSSFNSNGTHIYADSGSFNASLQVSTLEGCSSKYEFTITVHPKPIISFTTDKYCPYEEIEFSASNEYDIPLFFYNWEFGQNASTSTDIFPSYSYGTNGNYDVQLIAIDSNNCIDTVIQNVFIQPAPVTEISVSDPCELAPLEIIDNSSIDDTFSIVTYSWDYGDNTGAINPSEDKIYESYGQYNVQVVLEANNGCVDTLEQLITVHPKPVLGYDVGPACKNTWTSLENISTIPEGTLTETNWLINLQYNFNQQNTAFKFPTLGIQLVNLESISDQGCISDSTFEIDVQNEISADYTVNPMNLTSGTPIQFINESLGADSSFWDFGDGNGFQYNQNQVNEITYDQTLNGSSIDVALIITNDIGCRDTSSYTYEIKEAFLDLALQTLFVQDINGYLTVGVELSNLGSVMLENADLYLKSAENGSILENWTGQLTQNESEIYIFNAHLPSYSSIQDDTERFICVEGSVNNLGYLDVDISNNIICENIEGSGLVVLPIYPNPTEDDITVSILLTESSPLHIELVDQSGRLIVNQDYTENLDSGIHKIVLPFSSLQKGIYHLRVSDNNTTLLEKIVRY